MIVIGGLEDSVVPYPSMIDWYERATAEMGGRQNLEESCRLYLLPGRAHGRGRGCGNVLDDQRLLVDWLEKGVRPADVTCDLKSGEKLTVRPYPACFGRPVFVNYDDTHFLHSRAKLGIAVDETEVRSLVRQYRGEVPPRDAPRPAGPRGTGRRDSQPPMIGNRVMLLDNLEIDPNGKISVF